MIISLLLLRLFHTLVSFSQQTAQDSWAGGYNTKINHHVCITIIKLLSLPGIHVMHDGLLHAPLTTVVTRGREGGGGEDRAGPAIAQGD